MKIKSPTAKFWFHVIDMKITLFMFIKSLCESTFHLFLSTFEQMLPWMAVLDHINYARWGSVFLNDMKNPPTEVKHEFQIGNVTVKKSNR